MRISLDMLNTRNKEDRFLQACVDVQQRFVVDNTNPTEIERKKYIELAKAYHYKTIGYFFDCPLEEALRRNAGRQGKERIADVGLRSTLKRMEPLSYSEGFDKLYAVCLGPEGFTISDLHHEI